MLSLRLRAASAASLRLRGAAFATQRISSFGRMLHLREVPSPSPSSVTSKLLQRMLQQVMH